MIHLKASIMCVEWSNDIRTFIITPLYTDIYTFINFNPKKDGSYVYNYS